VIWGFSEWVALDPGRQEGDRSDEQADPECEYGIPPRGGGGPGPLVALESFLVGPASASSVGPYS
jgi:hypothetical protein